MSLLSRFSGSAKQAVVLAESEAVDLGYAFIGTEHLLLGVLAEGGSVASLMAGFGLTRDTTREAILARSPKGSSWDERDTRVLGDLGIDLVGVRTKVEEEFGKGSLKIPPGRPAFTPRSKNTLEAALQLADSSGAEKVLLEHVVLALLSDSDGLAGQIIEGIASDVGELKAALVANAS